jgi:DNA (cytosine-5)-methyltransferase 1
MNTIERDYEIRKIIQKENLEIFDNLKDYLLKNPECYDFKTLSKIAELSNSRRSASAAHYTSFDVCKKLVMSLPNFYRRQSIKILEPSVGVGNFLPHLIEKYKNINKVEIDVVDINDESLSILKILIGKIKLPANTVINYINADYLLFNFANKYDLVVGNPPFMRIKDKELLAIYRRNIINNKTPNIFSFFLEKSLKIAGHVAFILPKSIVNAPEFNITRAYLQGLSINHIHDFGEKAFFGVKIETVGITIRNIAPASNHKIRIGSHLFNEGEFKEFNQNYICDPSYPYWILYRCNFFDKISSSLTFGVFSVFRDRQITKKYTKLAGDLRVLKSRNILSNKILDIPGYDAYIDSHSRFAVEKYLNQSSCILVPNLTYNPRACFMPMNCVADGSVAILTSKPGFKVTKKNLEYFASTEFNEFYAIARNHGTRSLNIDSNSVFFFGIKNNMD